MIHPGTGDIIYPFVLAIDTCFVEFRGKNAHAAGAPWEGRNALDALVLAYQAIGLLRQQAHPTVRIHGKIHHGGEKPNIIPDYAQAEFYVRAPQEGRLNEMIKRVEDCFAGAALATSCEWSVEWQAGARYSNMANNGPLARGVRSALARSGCAGIGYRRRNPGQLRVDRHGQRLARGAVDSPDVQHPAREWEPYGAVQCGGGNR